MFPPFDEIPTFVHTAEFDADWERLGLADEDLRLLQLELVLEPETGKVMGGAGGLRKMRFGLSGKGKSGGIRVCYARFPDHFVMLLVTAYGKTEKIDLSAGEKKDIAKLLKSFGDRL